METITLQNDIKVFYIEAKSFPDGILDAHKKLHTHIPFSRERKYFGISRPENGLIAYKAAAEEIEEHEGQKYNCDSLVLKKGKYICIVLEDYMKDISGIGNAFRTLMHNPGLDPEGYCVEWYFNDHDVRCMIRLNEI